MHLNSESVSQLKHQATPFLKRGFKKFHFWISPVLIIMIVTPLLQTTWFATQAFGYTPSENHVLFNRLQTRLNARVQSFGFKAEESASPSAPGSSTTSLDAFKGPQSIIPSTQLQYKRVVDTYLDEVSDETMKTVANPRIAGEPSQLPILQQFRVIRETARICYPRLLETESTWGNKSEIDRRNKFVPFLRPVQYETFDAMFRLVDRDDDGQVSMSDLQAVLDSVRVQDNNKSVPTHTSSTSVDFEEFMGIAAEAEFYQILKETFESMDHKNTGYVRVEHISDLLQEIQKLYPNKEGESENACKTMIQAIIESSKTKDGKDMFLNYEDFTRSLLGMRS